MAEYVVSAPLGTNDLAMLTMDDLDVADTNGNAIPEAFADATGNGEAQFTEAAYAPIGKVEIDDVTNTLIYTPAAQNRNTAIEVKKTLTR
ncbi:MAG: hypothetical protein WBN18_07470 [Flavobacteriaceae bacterium]